MKYQELNQTTPYNYFPTGNSARFDLPEDKVDKFCRLWRKYNPKKKKAKSSDDFTANEPVSVDQTSDNSNLIMVGGLVGESFLDRYRHLASISQQIWCGASMLHEDSASFYVFRTDNNQVLARGLIGYDAAKDRANQIRKRMGLKWGSKVKFKIEKLPPSKRSTIIVVDTLPLRLHLVQLKRSMGIELIEDIGKVG